MPKGPSKNVQPARDTASRLARDDYDKLIRHATELRYAVGEPPRQRSQYAAYIARNVLQLSDGNVLVKIGALAKRLGVDLHTLTRGFSSLNYPHPPKEMQIQIRSAAARRLLCKDNNKIDSIATLLGYHELGAFTKFFQKQNGISPRQYRKERCQKKP